MQILNATESALDPRKYARLLSRSLPSVIKTEEENRRVLGQIDKLMVKGERRTAEEDALLELLSRLVEDFETERYPIADVAPHELLQEIMQQSGLKQADLVKILGSSSGTTSEIVRGKRRISRAHAKALAKRFGVPVHLFL